MARAALLGSLILVLLLLGLAALRGTVMALAIPLIVYLFYGLWRGPGDIQLDVERQLSEERVTAQKPVVVRVTVTNRGQRLDELALEDQISASLKITGGSIRHLVSLGPGQMYSFEYELQGPRGGFTFEQVHAEAWDDLGVVHAGEDFKTSGQLFVLPGIGRIPEVPIRPRRTRVYAGAIPARVGGAGVEFFGVRDYEPGDPPRTINWRISARHLSKLYSNEYQQERVADVGIVLDGRERSNLVGGGHSLFEHSVLAAGALANAFLDQGNRVGLLIYGEYLHWTVPGYGKLQRERILHALARAAPGMSQLFDGLQYLPARVFPAESQIVLVSPLLEDDYPTLVQLRARGHQVLAVAPDPISFERAWLPRQTAEYSAREIGLAARILRMERDLLLRRIKRAGVQLVEWDVEQPFDQAMRSAAQARLYAVRRR